MTLGYRVRERREALKLKQPEVCKALRAINCKLSQGQLSAIENDEVKSPRCINELAAVLRTTYDYLKNGRLDATGSIPSGNKSVIIPNTHTDTIENSTEGLIVWHSASGGRTGGTLVYNQRKAGLTTRPGFLSFQKLAFAYRAADDQNAPVYKTRDTILVDPESPAVAGDDCLFVKADADDPWEVEVCNLVRMTPTHWIVRQYSKPKEYELARAVYPQAWPIVGKYNRR